MLAGIGGRRPWWICAGTLLPGNTEAAGIRPVVLNCFLGMTLARMGFCRAQESRVRLGTALGQECGWGPRCGERWLGKRHLPKAARAGSRVRSRAGEGEGEGEGKLEI